jgi:hypothetical protein
MMDMTYPLTFYALQRHAVLAHLGLALDKGADQYYTFCVVGSRAVVLVWSTVFLMSA